MPVQVPIIFAGFEVNDVSSKLALFVTDISIFVQSPTGSSNVTFILLKS